MRIGIDFDNTIVSYDALFHKVAVEAGLVPADLPPTKIGVRDYLRKIGREDDWTEMQGYVYGARMAEASAYPGVFAFMRNAQDDGHELFIVSHKTKHPFRGVQYDLHLAARDWVAASLKDELGALVPIENVFFELTKEEKLKRVESLGCECFIDDLPEILLAPLFPVRARRILFDPDGVHVAGEGLTPMKSWAEIARHIGASGV